MSEKKFFISEKFKEGLQQQVIADTWGKGFPMVYLDENRNIVKHWADGRIEIVEEKEKFVCKKVKFATKKDAEFSISKIKNTSTRNVIPVRAYECKCGAWHLTSKRDMHNDANRIQELEEEKELLNAKIKELEQALKSTDKQSDKEYKIEAKKDKLVKELNHQLKLSLKTNERIRKDNEELIIRLIKLNEKLNGKQLDKS
jgi:hypothetical protein